MKTKQQVLEIIHDNKNNPRKRFNALYDIFKENSEAAPAQKRYFNSTGYSVTNLESLEYEVKKLYNIKDVEIRSFQKTEKKEETLDVIVVGNGITQETLAVLMALDIDNANYHKEIKPIANKVAEEEKDELKEQKKDYLVNYLSDKIKAFDEVIINAHVAIFDDATEEVKDGIKLRDEFPFLKDEDCPNEFKILVADKFTAYENYINSKEQLKKLIDEGQEDKLFELAKKAVENFETNLEIYDELNYYKEKKEILGVHPIFADIMLQQKVDSIKDVDLTKSKKNLEVYINRETKKLEEMDEEAKSKTLEKISAWGKELALITTRIEKIQAK